MYEFIDTTEQSTVQSLPTEAVSIDGLYIEEAIPGYRTLYTKGRESLSKEITSYSVGSAHGERVRSTRYEARVLTIGFQIIAEDAAAFRAKFNALNNILSSEDSDFIFADEPDKFFSGIPVFEETVDEGTNAVTGEWKIFCSYPFKRTIDYVTKSTEDTEGVVVDGNTAVFSINYDGTIPAKPLLQAEFAGRESGGDTSDDGDCGFVAFMDTDENIIVLGNSEDPEAAQSTAETLANRTFTDLTGWDAGGSKIWNGYAVAGSCSPTLIRDAHWHHDKGQNVTYAKPAYGSSTANCAGPKLGFTIPSSIVSYGPDFGVKVVQRMCCEKSTERGTFQCMIRDSAGKAIAGYTIIKSKTGDKGTIHYIVNGKKVGTGSINLAYYNTNFGYCKKTAIYKTVYDTQYYNKTRKKWQEKKISGKNVKTRKVARKVLDKYSYTQSSLISTILKQGDTVTFKIGRKAAKSFKDSDIETLDSPLKHLTMHFGKYKGKTALHTNAVRSVKWTAHPTTFETVSNMFQAGDIVEADCNDASVYLMRAGTVDGQPAPRYGALGNDWDDFSLQNGENTIAVTWSDWVDPAYKPVIRIMYNEVYI